MDPPGAIPTYATKEGGANGSLNLARTRNKETEMAALRPTISNPGQTSNLPAVVRERLVGLGHAMRFLTLFGRATAALRGFEQLGG